MAEHTSRRRRRRRPYRRNRSHKHHQKTALPSTLPEAPTEIWEEKNVKAFATKRKKKDLHLSTLLANGFARPARAC